MSYAASLITRLLASHGSWDANKALRREAAQYIAQLTQEINNLRQLIGDQKPK